MNIQYLNQFINTILLLIIILFKINSHETNVGHNGFQMLI